MIDKDTVAELHRLYSRREALQRSREEAASRNFWLGIINDACGGTGTRAVVRDALGGSGDFADMMLIATSSRFEQLQQQLDADIAKLGGTP